ncbi:MAG TPA: phospholipid carrier-dependent glycosyltransferase [Vitreimonas sp.]|nr:phospholipid carrier-dependent glycosyltransferase [Vitreimonas sp.]
MAKKAGLPTHDHWPPSVRWLPQLVDKYRQTILIAILAFAFVTRVYRLDQPATYIFDEVYHSVTAKLIARNDPRAYEWWNPPVEPNTAVDWLHPPLAKYTQALAMLIFGENAFGWRISSVMFGVMVIYAVYALSKELFEDEVLSLLAALLASLDGLLLVQSRIAMNDIHVTFFILLTLLAYVQFRKHLNTSPNLQLGSPSFKRLLWTGLAGGLAMGSKWSGVFAIGIVGLCELWRLASLFYAGSIATKTTHLRQLSSELTHGLKAVILTLVFLPISLYFLSYSHMFLQGKDLAHFQELHRQIWWYQTHLTATHGYQSRPFEWFLNLRPVWYHVQYSEGGQIANIYAQGNTALFWSGAVVAILTGFYFVYLYVALPLRRPPARELIALWFTFMAYCLVWVLWIRSPRIMFFYHYTPAVPLMCILLSYWLVKLARSWDDQRSAWLSTLVVLAIALNFVVWYPNWTGIPVSTDWANQVYFALPSWK